MASVHRTHRRRATRGKLAPRPERRGASTLAIWVPADPGDDGGPDLSAIEAAAAVGLLTDREAEAILCRIGGGSPVRDAVAAVVPDNDEGTAAGAAN